MNRLKYIILILILPFQLSFGINPSISQNGNQDKKKIFEDAYIEMECLDNSILLSSAVSSFDKKFELKLSYGNSSTNGDFLRYRSIADSFVSLITLGLIMVETSNEKENGPTITSLKYSFSKHWNFGFTFAHLSGSYDKTTSSLWGYVPTSTKHYEWTTSTYAADIDFKYLQTRGLSLYSAFSFGFTSFSETYNYLQETIVRRDFHLTFAGLSYGKSLGFNAEFGIGYKGVLNLGIYAKW